MATVKKPLAKTGVTGNTVKKAVRAPAFRIETMQKRERYLKALIYGNYGVGKTTLAASAIELPSMNNVLIINAERGDLSIDHIEELDAITVDDFKKLGQVHEFLRQHCIARDAGDTQRLREMESTLRGVDVDEIGTPREYRTVMLDSLTEIESMCFAQLLGITTTTRLDEETQSAEWGEYKKNNTMMLRVVRAFRDLPMNVVFIAGEKYNQDETKRYKYTIDLTGQLAKKIQGFMDMVGYYTMCKPGDDAERRLFVTPSMRFDAKHRYQAFKGDYFDDPTLTSIMREAGFLDDKGVDLK